MDGVLLALQPLSLLAGLSGVLLGIVFGAIPGLSATLGIALLLPITFFMPPDQGLIMLGGVYAGGVYGGSISAILLNVPGTAAAVMTAMEGHAMAQQGRAPLALGLSAASSGIGGFFSAIVLLFLSPLLASVALKFGPAEYVALIVFSLVIVTMMLPTPMLGNACGCFFGLSIATIGMDPVSGADRLSYGMYELYSGLPLLPMLIGFFAMPQVLVLAVQSVSPGAPKAERVDLSDRASRYGALVAELMRHWGTLIRSTIVGIGMGILPAIGPVATPVTMHALEKRFAKDKARYGKGSTTGLITAETANNANVGGSLIPLLALGIPGSGAAAVFLGALTIHGLRPGPLLFRESGDVLSTFFVGFIIVNIAMMFIGLFGARYFAVVLRLPKSVIATFIITFAIFGAYTSGNSIFYVWVLFFATALSLALRALRIPILTVLMGYLLGGLLEEQTVMMVTSFHSAADIFDRPIAIAFFVLTAAVVVILRRQRYPNRTVRES